MWYDTDRAENRTPFSLRCFLGWHLWRWTYRRVEVLRSCRKDRLSVVGMSNGSVCERCGKNKGDIPNVGQKYAGPTWWHGPNGITYIKEKP